MSGKPLPVGWGEDEGGNKVPKKNWMGDFEYKDEEYHIQRPGCNPEQAKKWDDIVKCMKEAYPGAQPSDLFNVCVAIRELKTGNRITLGAGADGAIAMSPRAGVAGPDLRKIHCSGRRTVFHACFMSDAVDILVNGPRGRLTERDAERQMKLKPLRKSPKQHPAFVSKLTTLLIQRLKRLLQLK